MSGRYLGWDELFAATAEVAFLFRDVIVMAAGLFSVGGL